MKKLFFLTIILVASHFIVNAQTTRFGFTAGASFANYTSKVDGETDNANSKTGITAGILADIPVGKQLSFQPAVNFVQKGTKDEQTYGGVTEKVSLNINLIELPLNFLYNFSGKSGNFFIGAGPSLAFSLSGKTKYDDGTNSLSENLNIGNGDDDDLIGLDLGANFMTGYCLTNGLFLSAGYNAGLNNLFPGGSEDGTLKSHYFSIKLGFMLKNHSKK
jgi:hypothetical protein